MARFAPVSRSELIRHFRQLGFSGPFAGSDHHYMVRGDISVRIPNPHGADIGVDLLQRILKQAGVTQDE